MWRKLNRILVSERQSKKATYYIIPTIWWSGEGKTVNTERSSVGGGMERGIDRA